MKKRSFTYIADWTKPDFADGDWEQIHVLRGKGLFEDASTILLRTQLPPGAEQILTPLPVTGEYAVWVNGKMLEKNIGPQSHGKGGIALGDMVAGGPNILAIETYSHNEAAGLDAPIIAICGPAEIDRLRSWRDLGFGFYCGRVLYQKDVRLDREFKRVWLDLGKVEHYVEVYVNGRLVDTLLWPPYEIEITDFVKEGANEITLVVSNSIANRFSWDVWGTRGRGRAEPSGVLGPASISIGE
jgi:hypothetical protein